jgi:hypothetical protein
MERMRSWLDEFRNYRHVVTEARVERWLDQFDLPDIDLGARVLDCVDFIANEKIAAAYRSGLRSLPGWHDTPRRRRGAWRFAAFSSSPGESGDAMLHRFRHANNLTSRANNSLFLYRRDLLTSGLRAGDTIVFVDDFSATGQQVVRSWPMIEEVLPEGPDVYLLLVAATADAIKRIGNETDIRVQADVLLGPADAVFSTSCSRFTADEKAVLRRYCARAETPSSARFGAAGYVTVFAHGCPNNTLAILQGGGGWEGLFRRYD